MMQSITSEIFMPAVMASCSILFSRCVNFTWFIEHTLQANDDNEKTSKLINPGLEEGYK